MMTMSEPFRRRSMDLDISRKEHTADAQTTSTDIRSGVERNTTGINDVNRISVDSDELVRFQVLAYPDVMEPMLREVS
jgi:hypothetical protein